MSFWSGARREDRQAWPFEYFVRVSHGATEEIEEILPDQVAA
jgi:hypothetical protein